MPTYYGGTPSPPDTRSLPANGQPLTIVNEASVGQAAYGGGGGGGGTPNPSFSSITMAANGLINCSGGGGLIYAWSGGTMANTQYNTDDTGNNYVLEEAYLTHSMAPNTVSSMTGVKLSVINQNGAFDGLQCGGIIFDGNGQGSSALTPCMASDVTGVLNVWASNVSISSMTISSINGAVPGTGGSIPPNLAVSSIQSLGVGQDLTIAGDNSAVYVFDAPGTILDIQFRPTSGLIGCIGANGTLVWIGGQPGQEGDVPVSISSLYTTVAEVVGANISSLNVSSINGAAPGGGASVTPSTFSTLVGLSSINSGAPAGLTVVGELTVTNTIGCSALSTISITSVVPNGNVVVPLIQSSNLNVSSINGAAYPPAGGGGVFSTLYESNSTIICDTGVTSLLQFPVVNGQGYNVSWQVGVIGSAATTVNAGENVLGLLSVDGGNTSIAASVTLAAISTNTALGFDSLQVGGCLNFKGGTNSNVRLEVYNATNSTITVNLGESYLVSY